MGRTGAHMLIIAGNHDDPLRLDPRFLLTEFPVGVAIDKRGALLMADDVGNVI